jgi:hypothetical protein
VPPLLEGLTISQVGDQFEGDLMGDDASVWPSLLASSINTAHAAVAQPDALKRTVHLSFGDTSGQEYVMQLTVDLAHRRRTAHPSVAEAPRPAGDQPRWSSRAVTRPAACSQRVPSGSASEPVRFRRP